MLSNKQRQDAQINRVMIECNHCAKSFILRMSQKHGWEEDKFLTAELDRIWHMLSGARNSKQKNKNKGTEIESLSKV